ncbi:hypothetical protein [Pontibacter indicus]|uniref:Helix-turn-helix domain-containing protein n=1 Tax=Pontibacter indicus TaxID=1317125 RepID=A0A1R3XPU1_9BACT|nr:hypothetical protein [Pontibacter indicus]SIT93956.1 hypothetical protein SAMN05444128_3356 [Pontibacter indicus]
MKLPLLLTSFFAKAARDPRLHRSHLCLYMALLAQRREAYFRAQRKELMRCARIGSRVTYHRCMRELARWGYIHYLPSYDPGAKSQVYIIPPGTEKKKGGGLVAPGRPAPA